jgi:hypothetical protein
MFVKRVGKNTLALNFEEAKKIEFEMKGCKEGQTTLGQKYIIPPKGDLILSKKPTEGKEKDSMDMESMQRMIKRLSNEIVDMK